MNHLSCVILASLLNWIGSVKINVIMQSDQEDSKLEEDDTFHSAYTEALEPKKGQIEITMMPFLKREYEGKKSTTERGRPMHPNELLFPLIYRQSHITSMFKFGENWYTWATERRTDGSKATNYFICYDEPKRCDEIGWERTDTLPKCAFQIASLMADDRACVNSFGVELHDNGACDGGEQLKVHHDRITFSLHEPTRGQTFKSALKRDLPTEGDNKVAVVAGPHTRTHKNKKAQEEGSRKKFRVRSRGKGMEGKGVAKERDEHAYVKRAGHNKIKVAEDVSQDLSD